MSRLQELKDKGWKNLTGEEREEYQALKSDDELVEDLPEQKPEERLEEETIEIKKSAIESLLARVETLESANRSHEMKAGLYPTGEWEEKTEKKRIHIATLKKFRETTDDEYMYTVDWRFLKLARDQITNELIQIYKITFRKKNGELVERNMSLSDFAKIIEREEVTILEKKKKSYISVVGRTRTRIVDPEGDGYHVKVGDFVPMKVTRDEYTCTIKMKDGTTFDIPESRLNP